MKWIPALVFATLSVAHALILPTFEGMDEPAHLSSILHFATGHGRPEPGRTRLHASIERAIGLAPGPYHQWEAARERLGGLSYAEWRRLPDAERDRRRRELAVLPAGSWEDGTLDNWQAQHPPLYYATMGAAVRLTGATTFGSAHRVSRVASAALFALTGVLLAVFAARWGVSPLAVCFVCLLPMWYVIGARISNDALAIPLLGLACLIAVDQLRRPAGEWQLAAWVLSGVAATLATATKAYGLAYVAVAAVAVAIAIRHAVKGDATWRPATMPAIAGVILVALNGWWLAENVSRGAGLIGLQENLSLASRGIDTIGERLPYVGKLLFEEPDQLMDAAIRAIAQAFYASNWTVGAAIGWFYPLQAALIGFVGASAFRSWRARSTTMTAALIVATSALAAVLAGIASSVLDYYILFGQTRLAQGFYVWGIGVAVCTVLALCVSSLRPAHQKAVVAVQALCLALALASDLMFWSGAYERDPVWRTPVRVSAPMSP
jgi:hypothetical protein